MNNSRQIVEREWRSEDLLKEIPQFNTEAGPSLTRLMLFVRDGRKDLIEFFSLASSIDRTAYLFWFCETGRKEYGIPASWLPTIEWDRLASVSADYKALSQLDVARWLANPALKNNFDLNNEASVEQLKIVSPAFFHSQSHIKLSAELRTVAASPAVCRAAKITVPLSNIAHKIWLLRKDLQQAFPLSTISGQAAYILWLITFGADELNLNSYQIQELMPYHLNAADRTFPDISRLTHLAWQSMPEYIAQKTDQAARTKFAKWFHEFGAEGMSLQKIIGKSESPVQNLTDSSWHQTEAANDTSVDNSSSLRRGGGINILGALTGDFGLGEHARTTALAAIEAKINSCHIDFLDKQSVHSRNDQTLLNTLEQALKYNTSVFIASPDSFLAQLGRYWNQASNGQYKIYYGAWELPQLPHSYTEQINFFFDEAWAQSQYQYDCLKRSLNIPVTYMPLSVRGLPVANFQRSDFGLPANQFLFLYIFDGASGLARKNPIACIEAFKKAFPLGTEAAGLVLKTKNLGVACKNELVLILREAVRSDSRIQLIESRNSRQETAGLQSLSNAYISLHRAEGFGLTIAESMLLAKPCIVTNFSGNTDFCKAYTSCLVDYELIPVDAEDYFLGSKQQWANADIEQAAAHMRRLFDDLDYAQRLGAAGEEYVLKHHSTAALGAQMKNRLVELSGQRA